MTILQPHLLLILTLKDYLLKLSALLFKVLKKALLLIEKTDSKAL